jgi:hypothetical protein
LWFEWFCNYFAKEKIKSEKANRKNKKIIKEGRGATFQPMPGNGPWPVSNHIEPVRFPSLSSR